MEWLATSGFAQNILLGQVARLAPRPSITVFPLMILFAVICYLAITGVRNIRKAPGNILGPLAVISTFFLMPVFIFSGILLLERMSRPHPPQPVALAEKVWPASNANEHGEIHRRIVEMQTAAATNDTLQPPVVISHPEFFHEHAAMQPGKHLLPAVSASAKVTAEQEADNSDEHTSEPASAEQSPALTEAASEVEAPASTTVNTDPANDDEAPQGDAPAVSGEAIPVHTDDSSLAAQVDNTATETAPEQSTNEALPAEATTPEVAPPATATPAATPLEVAPPKVVTPEQAPADGSIVLNDLGAASKRPAWVTQSFEAEPGSPVHQMIISSLGNRSEAEARKELAVKAMERLLTIGGEIEAEVAGPLRASSRVLRSIDAEMVEMYRDRFMPVLLPDRNIYIEAQSTAVGAEQVITYNAWGKLEPDDLSLQGFRNFVRQEIEQKVTRKRLTGLGAVAGLLVSMIAALFGYLKLDTATKGYYTWRLRFLALVAMSLLGSGAVYVLREFVGK